MLAATSAAAADCNWVSGREHFVAVETDGGYDIQIPDGSVIRCGLVAHNGGPASYDRVGEVNCDSGWEGVVFFASAELGSGDHERMVLMNDLWYRSCNSMPTDIGMGN